MNQTSVVLILGGTDNTYEVKQAKQVFIWRKKKKAFTAVLSVDLQGKILPAQIVGNRMLKTSWLTNKASGWAIKKDHRFGLNNQIYSSNPEITKALIAEILLVYWVKIICIHNIATDWKMILYLDY